jgi:hypothetical protein
MNGGRWLLRGPWLKGADSRGAGGFGGNTNRDPLRGIGIDIQPALDPDKALPHVFELHRRVDDLVVRGLFAFRSCRGLC